MDVIEVQPRDHVLLFGSGPTGTILAQMSRHSGAARLAVADPRQFKLELARKLRADDVVLVN